MKVFMLIGSIISLLSCQIQPDNDVIDDTNSIELPDPVLDGKTSQKVISYPEAGVNFITGHITNLGYLKRAATQIPTILIDRKGVLYTAWFANSTTTSQHGEGAGAYVTLAVSTDKGETWLENRLIIAPIDMDDCIFNPVLWMDPMGNVHFIWNKALNWWDEKGGVWETIITYNNRWIANTGPSVLMKEGVMNNKPIMLQGLDKVIYGNFFYNFDSNAQAKTFAYAADFSITEKKITTPVVYSKVAIMPNVLKTVYSEPQFLQVGDSVTCYVRDENSGIYFSKASLKNSLKNWTLFKPLTSIGDNASMRFYIGRLLSGNILLVTCNAKTRKNMTAYLSTDNGVTFPHKLLLDSRNQVSYPDVSQGKDGTIYLVYDRERNIAQDIIFAKFKESDVINNQTVTVKRINSF